MGGVDLQQRPEHPGATCRRSTCAATGDRLAGPPGSNRPIDSVYPRLDDETGLHEQAEFARSLGFGGKSAIHPRQLPVLHEVFTPTEREIVWAREVVAAFDAAGGAASGCPPASSSTSPWRGGLSACWTRLRRGPRRRRREDAEMTTDTSAAAGSNRLRTSGGATT